MRAAYLAAALLVGALCGCAGLPRAPETSAASSAVAAPNWFKLPSSLRAKTRGIVRVMGREFDMNGYVVARQPGHVRLRAFGDMGGTLFDVAARGSEEVVIENGAELRKSWLLDGALRDARLMFLSSPRSDATPIEWSEGRGYSQPADEGRTALFLVRADGSPKSMMLVRGTRVEWDAEFITLGAMPELEGPIPTLIHIRDHRIGYSLDLSVLEVKPSELADELFEAPK